MTSFKTGLYPLQYLENSYQIMNSHINKQNYYC